MRAARSALAFALLLAATPALAASPSDSAERVAFVQVVQTAIPDASVSIDATSKVLTLRGGWSRASVLRILATDLPAKAAALGFRSIVFDGGGAWYVYDVQRRGFTTPF